ncbi:hypothetical protein D4L85_18400 [Chryseolinea soli]|uniref:Uncharacterized protein n=1 Tax=Chryseolinea soli TaxID=2321403 RepID=A0A385SQ62_9BACT|nr:hypothetical protein D4L85_18400 [Chryseolinea soli]
MPGSWGFVYNVKIRIVGGYWEWVTKVVLLEKNSNNGTPTTAELQQRRSKQRECHIFLFKFRPYCNNPEAILFVLGAWIDV